MIRRVFLFTNLILALVFVGDCARRKNPPAVLQQKYQADAMKMCAAISECIKEDVRARLAANPARRDMILARMDKDLCVKEQFHVLLTVSVEPFPERQPFDPAAFTEYSDCAEAISKAPDCDSRKKIHASHPSCAALRGRFTRK